MNSVKNGCNLPKIATPISKNWYVENRSLWVIFALKHDSARYSGAAIIELTPAITICTLAGRLLLYRAQWKFRSLKVRKRPFLQHNIFPSHPDICVLCQDQFRKFYLSWFNSESLYYLFYFELLCLNMYFKGHRL